MGIVCLDIGGTSIKSGLLANGVMGQQKEVPTCANEGGAALLHRTAALVATYPGAQCVGVSTAGEVDAERGVIALADNIPGYTGLPVRDILEAKTGLPVALENDANAAALGEMQYGVAKGQAHFAMVCYGTGVGGALVINHGLYRGVSFSSGEFGGLITHPEAIVPGDAGSGTYERYASTTALVQAAAAVLPGVQTGRQVFAPANAPLLQKVVCTWLREVAFGLAGIIHCINPGAVVLGGGIMQEASILPQLQQVLAALIKPSFRDVHLLQARLGNTAALWGAGHLARQRMQEKGL